MTEAAPASPAQTEDKTKKKFPIKESLVETSHEMSLKGKKFKYKALAQTTLMKDKFGEATGAIFSTAYIKTGADKSKRPLIFIFNGGPGAGSAWLHLGLFGPKRVKLDDDGFPEEPPYQLVENEFSFLDQADLVFIDPIGTGFSLPASDDAKKTFLGLKEDIESVSEFIRLFVSKHCRWTSPLYLAGESYGTTRAAGVVEYLQGRHGLYFKGVMLISCILDFQTVVATAGHALADTLLLPSYAATSWYHKKLPNKIQKMKLKEVLKEAETFIEKEYFVALFKGAELSEKSQAEIAKRLSELTGLEAEKILRWRLRIGLDQYLKTIFEKEKRGVGRLDSRYLGYEADYLGTPDYRDPSMFALKGPYAACINDYLRDELKFDAEQTYELLNLEVNASWDWNVKNAFVDTSTKLRSAMLQNPHLQVLVASGYYDFATPYYAALYNFRQLDLPEALRKNLHFTFYDSGHMMYVHLPSLKQMKIDLEKFLKA